MCITVEMTIFYSLNCYIRIIFTSCYCVFVTIYLQLRFVICILYNKWMNKWVTKVGFVPKNNEKLSKFVKNAGNILSATFSAHGVVYMVRHLYLTKIILLLDFGTVYRECRSCLFLNVRSTSQSVAGGWQRQRRYQLKSTQCMHLYVFNLATLGAFVNSIDRSRRAYSDAKSSVNYPAALERFTYCGGEDSPFSFPFPLPLLFSSSFLALQDPSPFLFPYLSLRTSSPSPKSSYEVCGSAVRGRVRFLGTAEY